MKREYSAIIEFPELSGFVIIVDNEDIIALESSLTALLKSVLKSALFQEISKLFCLVKFLTPKLGVKLLERSKNVKDISNNCAVDGNIEVRMSYLHTGHR